MIKNIISGQRFCPTCAKKDIETELRFNSCMELEIEDWFDEYYYCDTCKKDWVVQWIGGTMTGGIDARERQFVMA